MPWHITTGKRINARFREVAMSGLTDDPLAKPGLAVSQLLKMKAKGMLSLEQLGRVGERGPADT